MARHIAEQGIVLLKNRDNILPVDTKKCRKIAVIGENAVRTHASNGGAAALKPRYEITPLAGIESRFGKEVEVSFARGYSAYTPMIDGRIASPAYDNMQLAVEAGKTC